MPPKNCDIVNVVGPTITLSTTMPPPADIVPELVMPPANVVTYWARMPTALEPAASLPALLMPPENVLVSTKIAASKRAVTLLSAGIYAELTDKAAGDNAADDDDAAGANDAVVDDAAAKFA
jgi:hypothetical protein